MYEFGQRPQDVNIPEVEEERGRPSNAKNDDTRPAYVPNPQASPTPFSHYSNRGKEGVPQIKITRPTFDEQVGKDEDDAGCCKCIIM
jgi:hypothetical protein